MWFRKSIPCAGAAVFRGLRPPLESLRELAPLEHTPVAAEDAHWACELRHPVWGEAAATCPRRPPLPPPILIEHEHSFSDEERRDALHGESMVLVEMEGRTGHALSDRKRLLRFLRALLGAYGLYAMDFVSQRLWSRAELDDELAHDADLDIMGLYTLHAVHPDDDPRVTWLHSHGLAEIGGYDFDILHPDPDLLTVGYDSVRALAFALVEGGATPGEACALVEPGGRVYPASVEVFRRRGEPAAVALRDNDDPGHNTRRVVLCEPPGGFLGISRGRLQPARFFLGPLPENPIMSFSHEASRLMAERARKSFPLFVRLQAEFAEFKLPALVKLGYRVDGGGEDDLEHLWFEVHAMSDEAIDATLVNEPYRIARMRAGQRQSHPSELLSDWTLMTPAGPITPRSTRPARMIRERSDDLRRAMRSAEPPHP
jgi:uncharacterized protein YegJ (DUF2314 family)